MRLTKRSLVLLGAAVAVPLVCVFLFRQAKTVPLPAPPASPPVALKSTLPSASGEVDGFYINEETESVIPLEKIKELHRQLMLRDLPAYALQTRGIHSSDRVDLGVNVWYFTIPQNRIPDFQQYLIDCGVPAENLRQDARMPFEVLPPPDPPATKLRFITSKCSLANGHARGMDFDRNSTVTYLLRNENLARSIKVKFSHATGNVLIGELRAD